MKAFLFALFHPSYWIQPYKYSKNLDQWFLEGLSTGESFTYINQYMTTLRGYRFG
jgi:hypothetical protein